MKGLYKLVVVLLWSMLYGQWAMAQPFTRADTLRGSNGSGRDWWDVTKYDLHARFNLQDSTISGWNKIHFRKIKNGLLMQIDLQAPLVLDKVIYHAESAAKQNTALSGNGVVACTTTTEQGMVNYIEKEGNCYFIILPKAGKNGDSITAISVYYHGKPAIARNPPWDGGMIWKKDSTGNPFISVACEGLGASVWYPCKDYQGDEPDSAEMHITVPDSLVCVGNGRLRGITKNRDSTTTFNWAVTNPINNYNLIPYIGRYVHFSEIFKGEKGDLTMDYWVIDSNLAKATEQFKDAARMMKAFEYWFGPYPFYKDGYKLVEAPHLGMEHQSAIAYGNGYRNGYKGSDRSGSGWGLKWDFIIVHESGHEWFGNNITAKDVADMWIHESFTNYSETLFTEYYYGKEAGSQYNAGNRRIIRNDEPIIGRYGVNRDGSGDMYEKGGNMIHNIRQVINNDSLFRKILRGMNKTFYHQTVTSGQIENYINRESGINFSKVFDQYLRTAQVPVLEYRINGFKLQYRYTNCVSGFNMPLKVNFKGLRWIKPTGKWKTLNLYPEGTADFSIDPNFYINTKKVK